MEDPLGCDPEGAADLLRALAHPMRLRILCRLLEGECAVAAFESELGVRQPNLSQQLAALRDARLVVTRREAKTVIYSLADDRVGRVLAALRSAMAGGGAAVDLPRREAAPRAPAPQAAAPSLQRPASEAGVFAVTGWNLPTSRGRNS